MSRDKLRTEIENLMESDIFKEQEKLLNEKNKTLKKGDNVVHLDYYGSLLDKSDFEDIQERFNRANLELSYYDKSGIITNSFEDFSNLVFVALQQPLIDNILMGIVSSATWETIKYLIIKTFKKTKNRKLTEYAPSKSEKKAITFGMNIKLNKKTEFKFRIEGELSDTMISDSLDKGLDFLREQEANNEYKQHYFVTYNSKKEIWKKIDVQDEIKKKLQKKK